MFLNFQVTEITTLDSRTEIKHLFRKNSSLDLDSRLPALNKKSKNTTIKSKTKDNMEDSDEFLPALVKSSISLKQENSVTVNINSILKYNDSFPIETFIVSSKLIKKFRI